MKKSTFLVFLPCIVYSRSKPNIVIIHTDEQSFRTLACYRHLLADSQAFPWGKKSVVETPNIDYLAQNGAIVTRCYATTPVSSPSRASFLTGLYPQHANVFTNDMELSPKAPTVAEVLRLNGYSTAYFGKLHLNGKGKPEWNPTRDFGFTDHRYMYNRGHWKTIHEQGNECQFGFDDAIQSADSISFPTDFLTTKAIQFIDKQRSQPFCCMLSLPDPHSPNLVRAPYNRMYSSMSFNSPLSALADHQEKPIWAFGNEKMENMALYFGMIKCIDDNVGRIIDELKKRAILDNTILVFTSDHGDMCGEHGLINKSVPMDGSARVSFIIHYPSKIKKGIVVENVMSVVDFTPSLLSLCGINSALQFDGRNISSLWLGKKTVSTADDMVFMRGTTDLLKSDWEESPEQKKRNLWLAVVTPQFKLVYSENKEDKPWLTDFSKDPDELVNCYTDKAYKAILKKLATELNNYGDKYKDPRILNPKIAQELNCAKEINTPN